MNQEIGTRGKLSFKGWAIVTWILAFTVPEILGVVFGDLAEINHVNQEYSLIIEWTIMALGTFASLYSISRFTGVGISSAIYKPHLTTRSAYVILLGLLLIIPLSYVSNSFSFPLLSAGYFMKTDSLMVLPFEILFYFSEIVVVTYMYLMASKGWKWRKGPFTSGNIFVIIAWASLHAVTKDVVVAVTAIVFAIISYICYEYSESPLAPIILWFGFLM